MTLLLSCSGVGSVSVGSNSNSDCSDFVLGGPFQTTSPGSEGRSVRSRLRAYERCKMNGVDVGYRGLARRIEDNMAATMSLVLELTAGAGGRWWSFDVHRCSRVATFHIPTIDQLRSSSSSTTSKTANRRTTSYPWGVL